MAINSEIPAQAVVAIATVVASLITGVIAVVNLTLSKEQKISEMRQAWIDSLRIDLAQLFSSLRYLSRSQATKLRRAIETSTVAVNDPLLETYARHRAQVSECLYRIRLRLNKNETNHVELERLLLEAFDAFNKNVGDEKIFDEVPKAIETALRFSRDVLKFEWERVKTGERPFVNLRRWMIPSVLAITVAFVLVILLTKFGK